MSWSIFPPYPTHLILKSKSTYPLRFLLLFTDGSYLQRRLLVTGSYLHWATCSAHRSELVTILITLDQSLAEQMFSVCQSPVCMWGLLRAAEALTITETQLHDTIFPSHCVKSLFCRPVAAPKILKYFQTGGHLIRSSDLSRFRCALPQPINSLLSPLPLIRYQNLHCWHGWTM